MSHCSWYRYRYIKILIHRYVSWCTAKIDTACCWPLYLVSWSVEEFSNVFTAIHPRLPCLNCSLYHIRRWLLGSTFLLCHCTSSRGTLYNQYPYFSFKLVFPSPLWSEHIHTEHNERKKVLTLKVLVATIDAQWEGMGDVGSVRYEPALLPLCPTIRVLSHSN